MRGEGRCALNKELGYADACVARVDKCVVERALRNRKGENITMRVRAERNEGTEPDGKKRQTKR